MASREEKLERLRKLERLEELERLEAASDFSEMGQDPTEAIAGALDYGSGLLRTGGKVALSGSPAGQLLHMLQAYQGKKPEPPVRMEDLKRAIDPRTPAPSFEEYAVREGVPPEYAKIPGFALDAAFAGGPAGRAMGVAPKVSGAVSKALGKFMKPETAAKAGKTAAAGVEFALDPLDRLATPQVEKLGRAMHRSTFVRPDTEAMIANRKIIPPSQVATERGIDITSQKDYLKQLQALEEKIPAERRAMREEVLAAETPASLADVMGTTRKAMQEMGDDPNALPYQTFAQKEVDQFMEPYRLGRGLPDENVPTLGAVDRAQATVETAFEFDPLKKFIKKTAAAKPKRRSSHGKIKKEALEREVISELKKDLPKEITVESMANLAAAANKRANIYRGFVNDSREGVTKALPQTSLKYDALATVWKRVAKASNDQVEKLMEAKAPGQGVVYTKKGKELQSIKTGKPSVEKMVRDSTLTKSLVTSFLGGMSPGLLYYGLNQNIPAAIGVGLTAGALTSPAVRSYGGRAMQRGAALPAALSRTTLQQAVNPWSVIPREEEER